MWWDGARRFFKDDAGFLELGRKPRKGDPFVEIPAFIDEEAKHAAVNEMMKREQPEEESVPQAEGIIIDSGIDGGAKLTSEPYDMAGENIEDYYANISIEQGLSVEEAKRMGIAIRLTKKKKRPVPNVRQSGVFVPEEFATYKNFKDAKAGMWGGTKDITRYIQEIDGSLSIEELAKLPSGAGQATRYVLWRTRDMMKLKLNWLGEMQKRLREITVGLPKKQRILAFDVLEATSRKGSYVATEDFATNPNVLKITKDLEIIRFAQDARKYLETAYSLQNRMRTQRGQEIIPYRQYYAPHIVRNMVIWEKVYGLMNQEQWVVEPGQVANPMLPDYIMPNKPFNPRELARKGLIPDFWKEKDVGKLLASYANTAASDIFNTSIVANNKAFAQQLESMDFKHAAQGIQDWTAQSFVGVKAKGDQFMDATPPIRRAASFWRKALMISVFPLNLSWMTVVQTSSAALTVMRTGVVNSFEGMYDWFGNKGIREQIKNNSYSYIIKSMSSGKMTRQDINRGISDVVQLEKSKFDTVADATTYFMNLIERHLTGWSISSGLRQGEKAGLKGQALYEFASDQGGKTQSMYNLEDQPGMLRSEMVKTAAPFQTFLFEMYNTMKEFCGKTGVPPKTTSARIGWVLRFWAATTAINIMGKAVTGREPWEVWSMFPFAEFTLKPAWNALWGREHLLASGRGLPAPSGVAVDLGSSLRTYLKSGNSRKLRNWLIKYLPGMLRIPGGTQMSKTVDGIIAISEGGLKDVSGEMIFPISKTSDQVKAVAFGVWSTLGGQEYIEKLEERQKIFKPKRPPIKRR